MFRWLPVTKHEYVQDMYPRNSYLSRLSLPAPTSSAASLSEVVKCSTFNICHVALLAAPFELVKANGAKGSRSPCACGSCCTCHFVLRIPGASGSLMQLFGLQGQFKPTKLLINRIMPEPVCGVLGK